MTSQRNRPAERLQQAIFQIACEILNRRDDAFDPRRALREMGFDSITLKIYAKRLNESFGIDIAPSVFFTHDTIGGLADHLAAAFPRCLDAPAPAAGHRALYSRYRGAALAPLGSRRTRRAVDAPSSDGIAVIGMNGVFPGAESLAAFWRNLREGRDMVGEVPARRWDFEPYRGLADLPRPIPRWGGFIDGIDEFDAAFFGISRREAELMDPQHRRFLESAWHAIEDAGYAPKSLSGRKVGVFAGVQFNGYEELLHGAHEYQGYTATGTSHAILSNRVSYLFNLRGPSESIDTACSSSLVAIHRAVLAIQSGECEMALAGGVSLHLTPRAQIVTAQLGILSSAGRCRTFDASADGFVRGEGVAVLLLKPLAQALADRDHIYGVIKGSAACHSGRTSSLTAPEATAQTDVIVEALKRARLGPDSLGYIETHGTGTELGDPIEIEGIKGAFQRFSLPWRAVDGVEPCGIGSLKTNIGHLEAAAGAASMVKVLLGLSHKQIPPSLHVREVNPYLKLEASRLSIVTRLDDWPRRVDGEGRPQPRRAGVSSFGFGGANAHVIVEEAPEPSSVSAGEAGQPRLIALSARTPSALARMLRDLGDWLGEHGGAVSLGDLAYTLNTRGGDFAERCAFVASSSGELAESIRTVLAGGRPEHYRASADDDSAAGRDDGPHAALMATALEFTAGASVDWSEHYAGESFRRISLPGYPFERERFWIPNAERRGEMAFYEPKFVQSVDVERNPEASGTLLLIGAGDAAPGIRALWPRLDVVAVDAADDCAAVIARLRERAATPLRIVWHAPECNVDDERLAEVVGEGLIAFVRLAQSCLSADGIVQVVAVHGGESAEASAAAMSAWARAQFAEHESFCCRCVELGPELSRRDGAVAAVAEALSADTAWEVRYRDGARWTKRRDAQAGVEAAGVGLRQGGVYLVSGALGALGAMFSKRLARDRRARLVWLARRRPRPEQMEALRRDGAEVLFCECDVAVPEQVEEAVRRAVEAYGTVNGVLHIAGSGGEAPVLSLDAETMRRALASKVAGTINLDRATRHLQLDFFVGFSSLAAVLPTAGYSAYAAANGFLDGYLAARRRRQGAGLSLSIDWPLWADGGMRPAAGAEQAWEQWMWKSQGLAPLSSEDGYAAFERALGNAGPNVVVACGDQARFSALLAASAGAVRSGIRAAPQPEAVADAPPAAGDVDDIERTLAQLAARILKARVSDIDPRAALTDFGFDSLSLKEFSVLLTRTYRIPVTPNLFFQHGSLYALARYLSPKLPPPAAAGGQPADAVPASAGAPRTAQPLPVGRATPEEAGAEPIAIIGMAGVMPQSENLEAFWAHLAAGRDLVTEVPDSRWNWREHFGEPGGDEQKSYSKWGGFIDGIERFDAKFFNISPREAELMDPQHRLFLQVAWTALENACHDPLSLGGRKIGLFAGQQVNEYQELLEANGERNAFRVTGNVDALLVNRISYLLDLRGPSEVVSTACSSSLVAVHRAVAALRRGECEMALAGGVSLMVSPTGFIYPSQMRMLSRDGKCKTFDARADGYVKGEGAGAVVLKPLRAALRDGDPIRAVIRGSAVNHGGKCTSLTAPNSAAQRDVIAAALSDGGVDPATIGYVEAHGTGTELGDPVEIDGLKQAFASASALPAGSCAVGSVKTNIGHLEPAAGIAGLLKVVLALQHRFIPRSLHVETVNPYIDLSGSPFVLAAEAGPWQAKLDPAGRAIPRRAGVSAFGFGGANAHLVVEEAPEPAPAADADERRCHLIALSAKTAAALRSRVGELRRWMAAETDSTSIAELAYNLGATRSHFDCRCAFVVSSRDELAQALDDYLAAPAGDGAQAEALGERLGGKAMLAEYAAYLQAKLKSSDTAPAQRRSILSSLGELYCRGEAMDWRELYGERGLRRRPLPPYPFEKTAFWPRRDGKKAGGRPETSLVYYGCEYVEAALPRQAGAVPDGAVVVFDADAESAGRWRGLAGDAPLILVRPGSGFRQIEPGCYELAADRPDDYARLIAAVLAEHGRVAGVIHRWAQRPAGGRALADQLGAGLDALMHLAQALLSHQAPCAVLFAHGPEDAASPAYRAVGGFAKSLVLEHPALALRVVAFDSPAMDGAGQVECLWREWLCGSDVEVRYAGGVRRARTMAPVLPGNGGASLRDGGVYLITGGGGGLGAIFAEHLARRYRARLVLSGRSAPRDGIARQLERLKALGGDAVYVQADVGLADDAVRLVREAEQAFGEIHGVLHAAGVGAPAPVESKSREGVAAVLSAKVQGTANLDRALGARPLDFLLLFSSISSVIGNPENADYAFGNAFLDGFADTASSPSRKLLSISWPLWQDGGMKLPPAQMESLAKWMRKAQGLVPLQTERGLQAFERCLASAHTHLTVIDGDPAVFERTVERAFRYSRPADCDEAPVLDGQSASAASPAGELAEASAPPFEAELRSLIWEILKIPAETVEMEQSFANLGFDSISLKTLAERIGRLLQCKIMPSIFFSYETPKALAAHLAESHAPLRRPAPPEPAPRPQQAARSAGPSRTAAAVDGGDIAVIGISGVMPQSRDLDEFWDHLVKGRNLVSEVPAARWDWRKHYGDKVEDSVSKWGGFHPDFDKFDAEFFGITRREAILMDPQQRIFLQVAHHAFEDAAYATRSLSGRAVGVFAGMNFNEYQQMLAEHGESHAYLATGNYSSMLANRVSFCMNLSGPSETLDTACSTGLVAINRAIQAIRSGECEMALAGAVSTILSPQSYVVASRLGILSPSGRCHTFDERADGYVKGEGAGAVLLKPLAKALADGDHIHGVIKGIAVNHGGRANSMTAPNALAQARVIGEAIRRAGVEPGTIGYVETHGTGTALGDPVEIDGLKKAFAASDRQAHCALGALKANIGHLEAAAGMAAFLKVILALRHGKLPGNAHLQKLNPYIDLDGSPFFIPTGLADWPISPADAPRRAGVSSFGFGGSNAHAILEEAPARPRPERSKPAYLFCLSAKKRPQLAAMMDKLRGWLEAADARDLEALSFTLNCGRDHHPHRFACVASDPGELREALAKALEDGPATDAAAVQPQRGEAERVRQRVAGLPASLKDGVETYRASLEDIAAGYRQGVDPDWQALHAGEAHLRIPVPGYAFEKKRYWFDAARPQSLPAVEQTAVATPAKIVMKTIVDSSRAATGRAGHASVIDRSSSKIRLRKF
ncbi:SDR family NAD(P)-dependent oxidoreductase [Chromobacterium sp. CV08]|uniref:SDR family NAD(P)-dependent oxidoreductase n=1 Tax=Chromobacterium sp. CV08 TaxID=3133274 RepID=UPI003DA951CA